ncbi:MAG: thiolase family protein, partial [Bacillota bacterium]
MAFVYVIGSAMTRFGKFPQSTVKELAAAAVQGVLQDAALKASDIQAAFVANSFWGMYTGQHTIRGQVMLRPLGIAGVPITNVENACAGASTAFHLA